MAAPYAKRRKADVRESQSALQRVVHSGRCSNVALKNIIRTLRDSNARLELLGDNAIRTASSARARSMAIRIEMPLVGTDRTFGWELLDPCRLLAESVAASPFLQGLIASSLRDRPCDFERQWRMVIAFDEFAPGNKLKVDNMRKCMVLSFSFL